MITLPETNSSHLPGCAIPKENEYSNHPFSGARVKNTNMTLENPHLQQEIHRLKRWMFQLVM